MLWQGRWGGSGDDGFTHVLETGDGGCIVMGVTASTDGDAQAARGGKDGFSGAPERAGGDGMDEMPGRHAGR